jgi:capsular polysaccharide biosynthesis protein
MNNDKETLELVANYGALQAWTGSDDMLRAYVAPERARPALHWLGFLVRQRVVLAIVLAVGFVSIWGLLKVVPKTYAAAARVLIIASNNGRDPSVTSIDLPSVATSTAVLTHVAQKLNLSVLELKRGVRAGVKARSSIMEIGYRDKLADRAVAVPNAIADEVVTYYDSISSSGADVTIRKLDKAVAAVQQRLGSIDNAAAAQARLHPFVQSDKALDDATARLDDLSGQRRLANAALAAAVAQRDAISGDPVTQSKMVRYEKLQNDPAYRELTSSMAKDEAELAAAKATFTDQYPAVRVLQARVDAERAMSGSDERHALTSADAFSSSEAAATMELRKADAAVTGDQAKLAAIDALVAGANTRLADTLSTGVIVDRLKLQRDAAKADYLALTARRAAAIGSRAEALSLGSVIVVDRAVRADTALVGLGPTGLGIVLVVFVFALAISIAFVVDSLDPSLRRAEQIEKMYGVPLVGLTGVEGSPRALIGAVV